MAAQQLALTEMAAWLGGDIDDALERLSVPAHLVDRSGRVRWQNAKSVGLFGDIRGCPVMRMLAPEALPTARAEWSKKVLGTARTTRFASVFREPSGVRVPVHIHSVSIEDGERMVGVFSIVELDLARPAPPPLAGSLTPRQHQVLCALARGCSTAEIAASFNLSSETVRNHVRGLLRGLRVHSRLAAVAEARRRGLIE